MTRSKVCPECGQANLYSSGGVSAGGGHAPNYLPGLGGFLSSASFTVVTCRDCGLTRFFAASKALEKISSSAKWHKL